MQFKHDAASSVKLRKMNHIQPMLSSPYHDLSRATFVPRDDDNL